MGRLVALPHLCLEHPLMLPRKETAAWQLRGLSVEGAKESTRAREREREKDEEGREQSKEKERVREKDQEGREQSKES